MTAPNKLLELIAQRKAQVSRVKTIKPESGRNRYRILPSWRGEGEQFWLDFGQHFVKDSTGQIKAVFVCDDRTFGKPCDVCSAIEAGIRSADDDFTIGLLKDAKAGARVLLNVLELTEGKADYNTPKILEVAPSVFNGKKGVGGIISLFGEWPNLVNLADGVDIIIEKSGSGKEGTSYGVQVAGSSKSVDKAVMAKIANLDDFVKNETEESQRRALTAISAISGVSVSSAPRLNAPAAPSAPALGTTVASNLDEAQEAALKALETPVEPAPPSTSTAPAAPTGATKSSDDELDALLAAL